MSTLPPRYPTITSTSLGMAISIIVGRRRSFLTDATALVARLKPPLRVIGQIPDLGGSAWLVIINHNHRPGFIAWWMPLSITAMLRREIHWIMTSAWRSVDRWGMPWLTRLVSRWLRRAARIYGFTSMPPMPPLEGEAQARAFAVHQVLKHIDSTPDAIIGMAPEGRDSPSGELITPPPGVGRFACQLARRRFRLLPAGVFEVEGNLCLQIGRPQDLPEIEGTAAERDQKMSEVLMRAIARCIPEHMRGAYS